MYVRNWHSESGEMHARFDRITGWSASAVMMPGEVHGALRLLLRREGDNRRVRIYIEEDYLDRLQGWIDAARGMFSRARNDRRDGENGFDFREF